jgi:hypothetical protein
VYFGKLKSPNSPQVILRDVFYLQLQQSPQVTAIESSKEAGAEKTDIEVKQDKGEEAKRSFNLLKLGSEVHGPADEMIFNRDHVMFWENLRPDSKVVKSILEVKSKSR